jgi:hypothetical protein
MALGRLDQLVVEVGSGAFDTHEGEPAKVEGGYTPIHFAECISIPGLDLPRADGVGLDHRDS